MIKELLVTVAKGELGVEEAYDKLKHLPFEEIGGFARLDHHRRLRTGFFEVIFGQGKSIKAIREIVQSIIEREEDLLITKTTEDVYLAVHDLDERIKWHQVANAITLKQRIVKSKGNVLILTGGTGDLPIAEEAVVTLGMMDIETTNAYDVGVAGIHRLFDQKESMERADCIVVVAGMDGALASVVAGLVAVPVVAVPTSIGYGASFEGLAALLSMLNACAPGVACVNIDNGFGAGYLAGLIVKKQSENS
jgi:NCAIR mutase (PurE)-related protein